jgi:hypothetical protein
MVKGKQSLNPEFSSTLRTGSLRLLLTPGLEDSTAVGAGKWWRDELPRAERRTLCDFWRHPRLDVAGPERLKGCFPQRHV